jgi:hypothetical protein
VPNEVTIPGQSTPAQPALDQTASNQVGATQANQGHAAVTIPGQEPAAGNGQTVEFKAAVSPDAIRRVINVAIPVMRMAARLTPTGADDMVVALLETLVKDPSFADTLAGFLGLFDSADAAAPAVISAMTALKDSATAAKAPAAPAGKAVQA